jgi:hypothetical protein
MAPHTTAGQHDDGTTAQWHMMTACNNDTAGHNDAHDDGTKARQDPHITGPQKSPTALPRGY